MVAERGQGVDPCAAKRSGMLFSASQQHRCVATLRSYSFAFFFKKKKKPKWRRRCTREWEVASGAWRAEHVSCSCASTTQRNLLSSDVHNHNHSRTLDLTHKRIRAACVRASGGDYWLLPHPRINNN